jgi:hypothetical protein
MLHLLQICRFGTEYLFSQSETLWGAILVPRITQENSSSSETVQEFSNSHFETTMSCAIISA